MRDLPSIPSGGGRDPDRRCQEAPPLPRHWIRRERLESLLGSPPRPLTIVTGPGGSGKTLLVAGWARKFGHGRCVWVALPGTDAAAARQRLAAAASHPVAAGRRPGVLVVDGIDLARDLGCAEQLLGLVRSVPDDLSVVLIGRHRNGVSPGEGERPWAEVGGADLRFTVGETLELYRAGGLSPSEETARAAAEQNEGWATGLCLAVLGSAARAGGGPPDVVADRRALLGYFDREILGRQPEETREFLQRISVAPRVTVEVAEAITGRSDARVLLERLADEEVFVGPAGDGSYRLHRLFAEALTHSLALRGTAALTDARSRAAAALEEAGEDQAATEVLIAAKELDRAFAIRLRAVRHDLEWQPRPVGAAPLPGGLPDRFLCADPWRIYATCVALLGAEATDAAGMWLERFELAAVLPGSAPGLAARAQLLRGLHALMRVDPDAALRHLGSVERPIRPAPSGPHGLADLPELACLDADVHLLTRCVEVRAHAWLGHLDVGYGQGGQGCPEEVIPLGPACRGTPAARALADGRLRDALELSRAAMAVAADLGCDCGWDTLDCRVTAARAFYERNELPASGVELERARELAAGAGRRGWAALVCAEQARIAVAEGRFDEALALLAEGRRPDLGGAVSPFAERLLDEVEIRCRLGMGDVTTALRLFAAGPPALRTVELAARVELAAGRPDAASAVLAASGGEVPRRVAIERAVLRARCLSVAGNQDTAEVVLRGALDLARAEGFTRVFLDEPAQGGELLRTVARATTDPFAVGLLDQRPRSDRVTLVVLEPLTSRERELLSFLPSHLSQHQIARQMYISANTVKTHMKGLYRKLGASSRSEAVDAARSCGLL